MSHFSIYLAVFVSFSRPIGRVWLKVSSFWSDPRPRMHLQKSRAQSALDGRHMERTEAHAYFTQNKVPGPVNVRVGQPRSRELVVENNKALTMMILLEPTLHCLQP